MYIWLYTYRPIDYISKKASENFHLSPAKGEAETDSQSPLKLACCPPKKKKFIFQPRENLRGEDMLATFQPLAWFPPPLFKANVTFLVKPSM